MMFLKLPGGEIQGLAGIVIRTPESMSKNKIHADLPLEKGCLLGFRWGKIQNFAIPPFQYALQSSSSKKLNSQNISIIRSLYFLLFYLHIALIKAAGLIITGTLVTLQPHFTVQIYRLVYSTLSIFGKRSAPGTFCSYILKPNNFRILI